MKMNTIYYRVSIEGFRPNKDDCEFGFGEILGRHKDYFAAHKLVKKSQTTRAMPKQVIVNLDVEGKVNVGDVYRDEVWEAYVEQNRQREVERCADIIEKMKTGMQAEEACKYLHPMDEYNEEMTFDDWCERFSEPAERLIESKRIALQEKAEAEAKQASIVASFDSAAGDICYSFPAVKGVQANKEYYIAQVPFKYLVKFFTFADESLSPELRAQRKVNEKHANDIGDYVINNRSDYVLPSITASVSEAMEFVSVDSRGSAGCLGILKIPLIAQILTNDGQHRLFAASRFIEMDKTLGDETISVTFYYDQGLEKSKQIFADLNANMSKPSAAINALYDRRNKFNCFVLDALKRHEVNRFVDFEQTTIGAKSDKLWSLVHWKKFAEKLLGVKEKTFCDLTPERVEELNVFFDLIVGELEANISQWALLIAGDTDSVEMRNLNISGHAVYLESIGLALSCLIDRDDALIKEVIKAIGNIPTAKDAGHWENRCVVAGRMIKSTDSVKLTAGYLRKKAGLALSDSMKETVSRHNPTVQSLL